MTMNEYLESRRVTILDVIAVTVGGWLIVMLLPLVQTLDSTRDTPDVAASDPESIQTQPVPTRRPLPSHTPDVDQSLLMISQDAPAWLASMPQYEAWAAGALHYGAFAVAETGEYGWVHAYNDPQMAAQTAVSYCENYAGGPCRVVARSLPRTPIAALDVPMSTQVAREYATNNARAGFRDFATAENGAYGMAWGYATHVEARQAALARCRYYIRDRAADLPAVTCCLVEWRKRDIQRRQ